MLLFSHWTNEEAELPLDAESCLDEYEKRKEEIDQTRQSIFPGETTIDYFDNVDLEMIRSRHLLESLDSQGEQENNDDLEEGIIDHPDFETFGYTGNLNLSGQEQQFEDFKYKKICLPSDFELEQRTRQLVPEQMSVL